MRAGKPVRSRMGMGLGLSRWPKAAGTDDRALALNFASGSLDSRITFTRASSATRVNSSGLIETVSSDVARFDYDPATLAAKGLLIEEARTNLCLYSSDLTNAVWAKAGVTITADQAVSPDGTTNSDLASVASGGEIQHEFAIPGNNNTFSIYVKQAPTGSAAAIRLSTNDATAWNTGVSSKFTLTSLWQRIDIAGDLLPSSAGNLRIVIGCKDVAGNIDTDCIGDVLIWGAQLEAGAFATSYIPTTSATVTRAADVAVMTGANFSDWFTAASGTFITQGDSPGSGTRVIIAADDNTANENFKIYTSTLDPKFLVTDGGVAQADIDAGSITASTAFKLGAAYSAGDFAASANGGAAVTDASGTIPTVDRLRIGADQAGNYLNGHISSIVYYGTNRGASLASLTA